VNRPETYSLRHYIAEGRRIARIGAEREQRALAGKQANCEGRQKSTNDKTKKPEPEGSGDSNKCTTLGIFTS